jgi:DNA-binding transcriptional LysR family regulator
MLNLYKLEVFDAVVRAGSFTGAAERLLMTQPAVSQHVQDLEAALGIALFRRGRRGVELTDAGSTLHEYTQRIFALVADAEAAVVDVKVLEGGQVRVGATPGAAIYLLPEMVQEFRAAAPRLTVAVRTGITPEIVEELLRGRLDLGVIEGELDAQPASSLRVVEMEDVEQLVIAGRKSAFWERQNIAIDELAGQTLVVRQRHSQSRIWLEQALREHGILPQIGAEFDAMESIKRAVALGSCVSILPDYVVRAEVEAGTLRAIAVRGRPLSRKLKLVWDPGVPWSPPVRAFVRSMAARLPQLERGLAAT